MTLSDLVTAAGRCQLRPRTTTRQERYTDTPAPDLADNGHTPRALMIMSKPYMQRRAFATCGKIWPDVEVVCASESLTLGDYIESIGDGKLVIDMLVGDLQRVVEYPKLGFAVEQPVPDEASAAYERLVSQGFTSRLLT